MVIKDVERDQIEFIRWVLGGTYVPVGCAEENKSVHSTHPSPLTPPHPTLPAVRRCTASPSRTLIT
jgi:hypothetical protein